LYSGYKLFLIPRRTKVRIYAATRNNAFIQSLLPTISFTSGGGGGGGGGSSSSSIVVVVVGGGGGSSSSIVVVV
jgi:hypothetical protein